MTVARVIVGKVEIPTSTPSLNRLLAMHWAKRQKLKAEMLAWVRLEHVNRRLRPATKHRYCQVVRYYRHPRYKLDADNLAGGAKPLIDALVYRKLLLDDSPEHVTLSYEQQNRDQGGTLVLLSELED